MTKSPESGQKATAPHKGLRPSLVRNILSNWVSTCATIGYSLVVTPIVVHALRAELYGIWTFLNGLLAYANLFYLGLGATLIRYAAEHHAKDNRPALNRLASVVLSMYGTTGLVCVGIAVLASPLVVHLLPHPPAPGTYEAAKATAVLLGVRLLFVFVGSVFTGIVVAEGRYELYNLVSVSGTFVRFVTVPLVMRGADPLLALAVVVVGTGALETLALVGIALRLDPALRLRPALPTRGELRALYGFGLFAFLLQLASRIISYTDTTVVGVMLGAASVAFYSLPLQLAEYARVGVYGVVSVLLPHLSGLLAGGRTHEFREMYLRSVRTAAFVSAFLNVNIVFLGVPFLRLWVGPAYADAAPVILTALAAASFLQSIATQSQTPFCMALNSLGYPVALLLVEAVVNLGLSVALARPMGLAGVAVGTVIPALFCSALFIPPFVARKVGVPLPRVAREALMPAFALVLTLIAVHAVMAVFVRPSSYLVLVAEAAVTLPFAVMTAVIFFPRHEVQALATSVRSARARVFRTANQ